jgi:membrane-associated phospholipid phosphatase
MNIRYLAYLIICFILLFDRAQLARAQTAPVSSSDSARSIVLLPDTVQHLRSKFAAMIPPAALISYGALSFVIKPIRNLDYSIHNNLEKHHPSFSVTIDNYLQYAPIVSVYALNLAGVKSKNSFIDRTILLILSESIFVGATSFLKGATNRLRPDASNYLSFPSGHAGNAFTSAEFMAQEYAGVSPLYGVTGYSFATATAILRVYNDKHWFSDIVAGAGFGILSTKAAYLIYPLLRDHLFRGKVKKNSNVILLPAYRGGSMGFTFVMLL